MNVLLIVLTTQRDGFDKKYIEGDLCVTLVIYQESLKLNVVF